jgi:teichuronic acid biosynthesis glycosyltransferase TuaC
MTRAPLTTEQSRNDKTLKVLYVVPAGPSGTASMVFAHAEITRLREAGVATETVMVRTAPNPLTIARQIRVLRVREQEFQPHIVHAHFGSITAFITVCAVRAPVVITFRGSDLNPSPSDGLLRNTIQKLLSHISVFVAARAITVSKGLAEKVRWARQKVRVIPTGVDLQFFKPIPRSEARVRLGWSQEEVVVLFNAGLTPRVKRLDLAEEACKIASRSLPSIRLEVLDGRIPHAELPARMSAADCLLVTSDYEGSPDIVKEALACNLPIVSVDVGDVRERIEGVRGTRIASRDSREIAGAISELLTSRELSNGRSKISEIAADKIRDQIMAVYREIANPGSSRPA